MRKKINILIVVVIVAIFGNVRNGVRMGSNLCLTLVVLMNGVKSMFDPCCFN